MYGVGADVVHYAHDHNRRVQIYTKVYNQESDLDAQDKVFKVGPWCPSPGDCNGCVT